MAKKSKVEIHVGAGLSARPKKPKRPKDEARERVNSYVLSVNLKVHLFAMAAIILITTLIYSNTFHNSFHYDDVIAILEYRPIKSLDMIISQTLNEILRGDLGSRGILDITFALNYHFGKLNVFGYHLVNLILHILVSIMIYFLMDLTLRAHHFSLENLPPNPHYIPAFTSLLFAVHPIHTESVTYIVSRSEVLSCFFYLLSLLFFINGTWPKGELKIVNRQSSIVYFQKKILAYLASFVFFFLAMGTKIHTITLPAIMILYTFSFLFRGRIWDFLKKYKIPLIVFAGFALLILIKYKFGLGITIEEEREIRTRYQNLLTQAYVIVCYYLPRLFIPVNLNIDPDIPISNSPFEPKTAFSILVIASIIFFAIKTFNKYRLLSFSILWFFITISPSSSFIPLMDAAAEHRVYLPAVGFCLFLTLFILYLGQYLTSFKQQVLSVKNLKLKT